MRSVIALAFCLLSMGTTQGFSQVPKAGEQVAQMFIGKNPEEKLGYLIYLPKNYQPSEKFPLLIFLHGSGERGTEISLVKKHGPPKLIGQGTSFPMIVVSPQCPLEQRWNPKTLLSLLDDLESRYAIDPRQVHITGLSMGGSGTWSLIATAPERFATAVTICGHGDPWMAEPASRLPVWVIVGDRDRVAANLKEMVDSLRARDADVKWTLMTGVGHDSWTQTYATPELYEWMLRHRSNPR